MTKPQTEVEAALVVQMACTHAAGMAVLSRIGGGHGGDRHVAMMAAAAAKLLRAYTLQLEALRRWRNGASQYMRRAHTYRTGRSSCDWQLWEERERKT
jgi:hypothetical protein